MNTVGTHLLLLATLTATVPVVATETLETAAVERQAIPAEYHLDGVVEPVNKATLTAEIPGRIAEVLYDVGDVVPADAIIVRLRGTEQRAEVSKAEAQVVDARARVVESSQAYQRIESLHSQNAASQQALDQAKAALEVSEASLRVAQAQLTKAEERAGYTVIRAPYGGIVTQRHVEQGESVVPGQPLMSGFLPDELRVSVEVPQRLVPFVREHQSARVHLPGDERAPLNVSSLSIFPYANQGTGTTRVRLNLPYGVDDLFPGMLVKVSFAAGQRDALVIPESSIVYRSEVIGVYVVGDDDGIRLRRIRPGDKLGDNRTAVLAGLDEGEQVALDPVAAVAMLKRGASE